MAPYGVLKHIRDQRVGLPEHDARQRLRDVFLDGLFPDGYRALRAGFRGRRTFDRLVRLLSATAVRRVERWRTEIAPLAALTRPAILDTGQH